MKNYYDVLQVESTAQKNVIHGAYRQLADIYHSLPTQEAHNAFFATRANNIREAYATLSDELRRNEYNSIFTAQSNHKQPENDEWNELIDAMALTSLQAKQHNSPGRWQQQLNKFKTILLPAALATLIIVLGSTSVAYAITKYPLPFLQDTGEIKTEISRSPTELIENTQQVAASYECSVIATALQLMRVDRQLVNVPAVSIPTNDMSLFPSKKYCLYPDYLSSRYSQFQYTVKQHGEVTVDTSPVTTDEFITNIEQQLSN